MFRLRLVSMALLAVMSPQGMALEPWKPSDIEMANLPPYCAVKMNSRPGSSEYKLWEQRLGPDFLHTHHYCAGLNFINRYYRAKDPQQKIFNLQSALNNFDYMVTHAAQTYGLMPEIYLNRGIVHSLMDNDAQAVKDINTALVINPKLSRAYAVMADYYMRGKNQEWALQIITEGLRHNPASRSLKRRYDELGGKKPYPEPYADAATPPDEGADDEAAEMTESTSGAPASAQQASGQSESKAAVTTGPASAAQEAVEPAASTIGTPSNPFCRFCPPE